MKCDTQTSFPPLSLIIDGQKVRIRTLRDAAHALLTHWVDIEGDEYFVAVKACLDAITGGDTSAQDARFALLRAAKEAGMIIITLVDDRSGCAAYTKTAA